MTFRLVSFVPIAIAIMLLLGALMLVARPHHSVLLTKSGVTQIRRLQTEGRPPLADLIGDNGNNASITGDVQWLLDFAIIGHAKTGTTTQAKWISEHEQVQMYTQEIYPLKEGNASELVRLMYELPSGKQYKRGYKYPEDICFHSSRKAIQTYWPETKLVVGIRHPIHWFESWYNHKTRGYTPPCHAVGPPLSFVGGNLPQDVYFHQNLAMLGKTTPKDPAENSLLGLDQDMNELDHLPNKVFLYEASQPFDVNRTRAEIYAHDLSKFIQLSEPLSPVQHDPEVHHNKTIDICDEEFIELRRELMAIGTTASHWIQEYFMDLSDVAVSSPDHLKKILNTWLVDPCDERIGK